MAATEVPVGNAAALPGSILGALVPLATFQNMTARAPGDGLSKSFQTGFMGLCLQGAAESKPSAQIGLNRWPLIPCMV